MLNRKREQFYSEQAGTTDHDPFAALEQEEPVIDPANRLNKQERAEFIKGALLSTMLIAFAFIVGLGLFIWLITLLF